MGRTSRSATWLPGSMLGEHERLEDDFSLGCVFTPLSHRCCHRVSVQGGAALLPTGDGSSVRPARRRMEADLRRRVRRRRLHALRQLRAEPRVPRPGLVRMHQPYCVLSLTHLRLVRSSPPPPPAPKPIGLVLDADGFTSERSNGRLGLRLASASLTVNRCCGQRTGWRAPRR